MDILRIRRKHGEIYGVKIGAVFVGGMCVRVYVYVCVCVCGGGGAGVIVAVLALFITDIRNCCDLIASIVVFDF